jgi:hypothetical protein
MTDQVSFPPLHDPAPGELERRKQHLLSEIALGPEQPRLFPSALSSLPRRIAAHRRSAVVIALATMAVAIAGGITLTSQKSASGPKAVSGQTTTGGQHLSRRLEPSPTLAQPLPGGAQISAADAAATLGAPVVLPNSSLANSSNIGSVWAKTVPGHEYDLAIVFPSAGIIVQYDRPVPYPEPPAQMYQTEASQNPDSMSTTDLSGVPALVTQPNSDQSGTNFGSIEFVVGGTRIAVLGHSDPATLKSVAQTIVSQAGS